MKRSIWTALILFFLVPAWAGAQDIVKDALSSFPPQTVRLEASSPEKLRQLTDYATLRSRYLGPRLQELETSLASLGVQEDDIDQVVLGMRPGGSKMDIYGAARGRFDEKNIADRAASQKIKPAQVAGHTAYCLGKDLGSTCIAVLGSDHGLFGSQSTLASMLQAQAGGVALSSNQQFTALIDKASTDSTIWGVAVGGAVGDWFKTWMPAQQNVQLDWGTVFKNVQSLVYSVNAADKVTLDIKLFCQDSDSASNIRQTLEGLRGVQQLAWTAMNPGKPNPYQDMETSTSGSEMDMKINTEYAALMGVGAPGLQQ
jgi:hypothetical protein